MEASQNPPSKDVAPLIWGPLPTTSDTEQVADVSFIVVMETSLNTPPSDVALLMTSFPPTAPDAEKVTQATIKEAALLVSTSEIEWQRPSK